MIRTGKPTLLIDGSHGAEQLIRALPWTPREQQILQTEVTFLVSPTGTVPDAHLGRYDYVFSFDTFVHFELPLFLRYLRSISRMLMPGGVLHLHYANLQHAAWFKRLETADDWDAPCQSFCYIGREDLSAILYKFNLRRTDRELSFGANGSHFIECIKDPMAEPSKPAPRPPDYNVNCLNKQNEAKGKIGAAWINDDGSIRIVLDPFVVLPPSHLAVITLFKVGNYQKRETKPQPRTAADSLDDAEGGGDPPDNEVPF